MGLQRLDRRYELRGELGAGASATVFLAEDLALGRRVALKLAAQPGAEGDARLRREFELLGRLDHPHLPRVFEFGTTPEGRCYFTLELLEGEPLAAAAPGLSEHELVLLLAQSCRLLDYFERCGLVHGDLKPTNLIVTRPADGPWLKVIDLGLAGEPARGPRGMVRGTPRYAAASILAGEPPTASTDLHALGASFLDVVGRWEGDTTARRELRPDFLAVLERLVAPDADVRYRSAGAALVDLLPLGVGESARGGARFVGRESELARLCSLGAELSGPGVRCRQVWVLGEGGMGKSALLGEWQRDCELRGVLCVPVRASEQAPAPLGAWKDVLRHLALLEPAVSLRREHDERARVRALQTVLDDVARRRPFVILIEDAQWLDEASLRMLAGLSRPERLARWVVALALRTGADASKESEELEPGSRAERIELGGLAPEESEALLETLAPQMERAMRARIVRATEGRPGFLLSAVRAALERPLEGVEQALRAGLPALLAAELGRVVERLPAEERRAATALCVLVRPADLGIAALMLGTSLEEARRACSRLEAHGVLERDRRGPDERFAFAHQPLRLALLERLAPGELRALHERALAAREAPSKDGSDPGPVLLEHALGAEDVPAVLRHGPPAIALLLAEGAPRSARERLGVVRRFLASRSAQPGRELVELEGDTCFRLGELEEACAAYQSALAEAPRGGGRLRCKLARVLVELGRYESAREILSAALGQDASPAESAEVHATLSLISRRLGQPHQAECELQDGLRAMGEGSRAPEAAALWNNLGVLAYERNDHSAAHAHWRKAFVIHEANGDRSRMSKTLSNLGSEAMVLGRLEEAADAFRAACVIKEQLGDRRSLATTHSNLAKLDRWRGNFGSAIERDEAVLRMREEIGDVAGAAHTHASLSATWLDKGELGRAWQHAERACSISDTTGERDSVLIDALLARAAVEATIGRRAHAMQAIEEGLAIVRESENRLEEGRCLGQRGALADGEASQADLARGIRLLRETGEPRALGLGLVAAAQGAIERGAVEEARPFVGEASALARRVGLPHLEGWTFLCAGRLARLQGETEAAASALLDALERARALGTPELEWRSSLELARAHHERGQRTRAVSWLDVCVSLFRRAVESLAGEAELQDAFLAAPERGAVLSLLEAWLRD